MKQWFSESLHHGYQQRFEIEHLVYEGQSPYQTITLFDHHYYGRVLALDGIIQTTTHDEFIYHERSGSRNKKIKQIDKSWLRFDY